MTVEGDDPQQQIDDVDLQFTGEWDVVKDPADFGGHCRTSDKQGAEASLTFTGNQVRLLGRVAPDGGLADVYLDDQKQLVGIDCWCPQVTAGTGLVLSKWLARRSAHVAIRGAQVHRTRSLRVRRSMWTRCQWSAATGAAGYGAGGGPTDKQCLVMGYPGRQDIVDSAGNRWRPGTEFIVRIGHPDGQCCRHLVDFSGATARRGDRRRGVVPLRCARPRVLCERDGRAGHLLRPTQVRGQSPLGHLSELCFHRDQRPADGIQDGCLRHGRRNDEGG